MTEFKEWYIPSNSIPNKLHSVIYSKGKWSCTCERGSLYPQLENCKHIIQAKYNAGFAEMESLDNLGREKEIG